MNPYSRRPCTKERTRSKRISSGEVAEWFKAAVLKTAVGASSPWVRIPPSPPIIARSGRAGLGLQPLIDRLIITRVPVLIGEGIPLFGALPHDVRLEHVATRSYPSGLVQSEYRVERAP